MRRRRSRFSPLSPQRRGEERLKKGSSAALGGARQLRGAGEVRAGGLETLGETKERRVAALRAKRTRRQVRQKL